MAHIIIMIFQIALTFTFTVAANARNNDNNLTTKSTKVGYGSLWLPRSFRITCCLGGYPVPENPQFEMTRNWTHEESDYIIDERFNDRTISGSSSVTGSRTSATTKEKLTEANCRVFHGSYLLSASALFAFDDFTGIGVICKCPDVPSGETLDRNCRRLKPCLNNGHRSFSSTSQCICPEPYFGEQCEKYCDQGQRMKGADGRDYCGCVPFYQGEECRDMVCLNGGTEVRRRCRCPPNFLGYHCEIDANRTSVVSRFHGYGEQAIYQDNDLFTRDVSGTIFSLVMIVVLVLSMYLLMKHRMQVQNRFATLRHEAVSRSAIEINSRRGNVIVPENPGILSFRAIPLPDEGPPPYIIHPHRGRSRRRDNLPPLPSYEDATKLPPFTRSQLEDETVMEEGEMIRNSLPSNELQVSERVIEAENDGSAVAFSVSSLHRHPLELQQSLEPSTSVPDRASARMDIFSTDSSSMFSKKSLTRRSI